MKRFAATLIGVSLLLALLSFAVIPVQATTPAFNTSNFHNPLNITNTFFPLKPGTTLKYAGKTDGEPTSDTFVVTGQTKTILGIKTRVVVDTAYADGVLEEKTFDWFAQDDSGNVWYMGEATTAYNPDGLVASHDGSFQAGVDGAKPGIIMEAHPKVGDTYRQEYLVGVAQDNAAVLSLNESLCVTYKCFTHLLETKESTPLEPGVLEHKYYAAGIGEIKSLLVRGGSEESHLVSVKHDN